MRLAPCHVLVAPLRTTVGATKENQSRNQVRGSGLRMKPNLFPLSPGGKWCTVDPYSKLEKNSRDTPRKQQLKSLRFCERKVEITGISQNRQHSPPNPYTGFGIFSLHPNEHRGDPALRAPSSPRITRENYSLRLLTCFSSWLFRRAALFLWIIPLAARRSSSPFTSSSRSWAASGSSVDRSFLTFVRTRLLRD